MLFIKGSSRKQPQRKSATSCFIKIQMTNLRSGHVGRIEQFLPAFIEKVVVISHLIGGQARSGDLAGYGRKKSVVPSLHCRRVGRVGWNHWRFRGNMPIIPANVSLSPGMTSMKKGIGSKGIIVKNIVWSNDGTGYKSLPRVAETGAICWACYVRRFDRSATRKLGIKSITQGDAGCCK